MNNKLMLLLVLGVSLVLFGCAKPAGESNLPPTGEIGAADEVPPATDTPETEEPIETPEVEETPEDEPEAPVAEPETPEIEEPEEVPEETEPVTEVDEEALADLFQVDTDKPLEDEGYDVETPSAQE